ncbi:tetratricopeptide repeat protein [Thermoactinospora rubra]|uniref:tetratricopeptide repeat protein n=1 Tax=Thermoactinospora rubra TaxID=1088767 RepID=UPI000A10A4F5|nr:tetratricopeptide repeat protein [Thermoactinospora rubra]
MTTIDADRRLRGPYTFAAALLDLLVPGAPPDLVAAHDIEIRAAAPHLGVAPHRTSLAQTLPREQRILIPGARRTLSLANGLAEFVRDRLTEPLTVVVHNLAEADQTDRELVDVLRRRVPDLTIVEGDARPSTAPLPADFDRFRDEGFHHAMAESGLAALTEAAEDWVLLNRTANALTAIEREDEAWQLLQRARRACVDPVHSATIACSMATLLVRHSDPARRDPEQALGWINEAIAITSLLPGRRERAFHLGFDLNAKALVQVRRGRLDEAERLVQEAIALAEADLGDEHPIHRLVLYANRAQLAAAAGRAEEALADYGRAIAMDPGYPDYYLDRGNLLARLGRAEEALADYETVMRISPPSPEPYYNRAGIRFAGGDHAGALADLDYAVELDPGFAPAYVNRSGLLAAMGEYGGARRDVVRGLELEPRNAHLLCVLGQVEAAEGHHARARAAFDAALELQPDLAEAWASRGALAFELGEAEAAVADLTQAIKLTETAELLFNRAVALRACGRAAEAREDLLRAAELAPDDPDVRRALREG